MTKEDIINYVMNSPHNTNRAVLKSMLDEIGGSGESDIFIIHADYDWQDEAGIANVSATFQEALNALNNNKILVLYYHMVPREYGNQFEAYHFYSYYDYGESSSTSICFQQIQEKQQVYLHFHIDNSWTKLVV